MELLERKVRQLEAEVAALQLQIATSRSQPVEKGVWNSPNVEKTLDSVWLAKFQTPFSTDCSAPATSAPAGAKLQQAMSELRASEERFRLLVEGVQDYAIFMLDPTGHIVSWNAGARHIQGYQSDEILGRHFSCFHLPEEVADGKPERELRIAAEVGRYEEEGRRVRKGGQVFWALVVISPLYDETGILRGFAIVARDISERKQAEEKARMMVQLTVNALILVDARGVIVLANLQTEKLFGYSQAELLGQPVDLLVPEAARPNHPGQWVKFFENPTIRAMGAGRDLFGRRKDGIEFPVEIGLNPVRTDDELLVLGSIVDITERKRAEEKSRRHLAELAHAGRLSSVGEMFSELAHEINQPLAAAANYARACVRCAESNTGATREQLLDWMRKTAGQAERASEIVKRLGKFVKKERSVWIDVNINRLIDNVVDLPTLLNSYTDVGIHTAVELELDESLPLIFADKVQIEQVLVNLVRNAVDAMENLAEGQRRLHVKSSRVNGLIQVTVSDNGHGISPEQLNELFSPFFTTKPDGMGLGLSISRSIIETHLGQMFVTSTPGSGTSISFQLPIGKGESTP